MPRNGDWVDALAKTPGFVYETDTKPSDGGVFSAVVNRTSSIVGFVVEESTISHIRFEVIPGEEIGEGSLVFCIQGTLTVFYQVIDAKTSEETFQQNPHGTHIVTAAQLGSRGSTGFSKYSWIPNMNTPVFTTQNHPSPTKDQPEGTFILGNIPGTEIPVVADFDHMLEYHTAILGVTGTGKTEFAFDIIKQGISDGAKIFCVDFTGDYAKRLQDLNPVFLGLDQETSEELAQLIDNVETGDYSAAAEKKALNRYMGTINPLVQGMVQKFLEREDGGSLGIFELDDIANTRTTLRATELYLSNIFKWAKENRKRKRILIVLEEAHTVVPEMNLFGRDRSDTTAVVGRITQIALQGRKYGVGLLVISQRTALVSKTLLS